MLFVIAGFHPAPPIAMDLQARSTEDLSYASMDRTADALAFDLTGDVSVCEFTL
ncbi:MAG TPA: hypothetical protein VJ785_01400 [Anaerolineales bacterium]|nr:hypothetical protein [Anaerolineales bacterium]